MTLGAAYYVETAGGERDPYNWVPESSRRARGFAVYAALRSLGRAGLAEMLEGSCAIARRMADGLRGAEGVTILNDVVLNQVLVRFEPPGRRGRRCRRVHPGRDLGRPGRRHVLARWDDVARDGRDANLCLELEHDRSRRRHVRGGHPPLRPGDGGRAGDARRLTIRVLAGPGRRLTTRCGCSRSRRGRRVRSRRSPGPRTGGSGRRRGPSATRRPQRVPRTPPARRR